MLLLAVAACTPVESPVSASAAPDVPVPAVPGSMLEPDGRHVALDAAIDAEGGLHVVWLASRWSRAPELWHARRDADGVWRQSAQRLAERAHAPLRVLAQSGRLVLIHGPEATLMVSEDAGQQWLQIGRMVDGEIPAWAYDATWIDNELILVYVEAGRHGLARERIHHYRLREARWRLDRMAVDASVPIADVPLRAHEVSGQPLPPVLLHEPSALHVLVGVNAAESERHTGADGRPVETTRTHGRLLRWSRPLPEGPWSAAGQSSPPSLPTLHAVAAAATARGHEIVVAGTVGVRLQRFTAQTDPAVFMPPTDSHLDALYVVDDLTGRGPWLAWIDSRERATDRRSWRPLGGTPWSDQPDALNNDVFVANLATVAVGDEPPPQRLSAVGGLAERLAIAVGADGAGHVVWSGRRRVGRTLDEHDAPPELFHAALPTVSTGVGDANPSPHSADARSPQ